MEKCTNNMSMKDCAKVLAGHFSCLFVCGNDNHNLILNKIIT